MPAARRRQGINIPAVLSAHCFAPASDFVAAGLQTRSFYSLVAARSSRHLGLAVCGGRGSSRALLPVRLKWRLFTLNEVKSPGSCRKLRHKGLTFGKGPHAIGPSDSSFFLLQTANRGAQRAKRCSSRNAGCPRRRSCTWGFRLCSLLVRLAAARTVNCAPLPFTS